MQVLQSKRANFHECRLIDIPAPAIGEGQIKLKVERFSFTTNNITYAVMGDIIKYWSFFPAHDESGKDVSSEWGQIPVWGFASVVESNCSHISVGDRFFGYYPPAETCTMTPTHVSDDSFIDGIEHRAELPAGYNIYRSVPPLNDQTDSQSDNEQSLLYPLFVTAHCIHDMMSGQNWRDAEQVIVISASSKTSIGLAYALNADAGAPASVGLTSARNKSAVDALGLYNSVNSYDDVSKLDNSKPTTIIDMSGNRHLLSNLHQHLGDNMNFTLNVGITHSADLGNADGINTKRSEQFFAPGQIQTMIKRDGLEMFQQKSNSFIRESALKTRSWLTCQELDGLAPLQTLYDDVCRGQIEAKTGLMVIMG